MIAIRDIIKENNYVLGEPVYTFEKNFAKYSNANYCVTCSNGTSAMVCALKALNLPGGSEVIVQSNTYIAAPLAIEMCGLKIKIVDIDPHTLQLDLVCLEKEITKETKETKETKVVLVVHLYGNCTQMNRLIELKNKYGFYLIEDCAQAHGSTFDEKKLGTFGDVGCFSFYPTKNLGAFGEGGCIITNNSEYASFAEKYYRGNEYYCTGNRIVWRRGKGREREI